MLFRRNLDKTKPHFSTAYAKTSMRQAESHHTRGMYAEFKQITNTLKIKSFIVKDEEGKTFTTKRAIRRWVLIGGRLVSNIRYANNTVLLARSEQDIAKLLLRIEMISGEVGLELNRGKCQLLMIDRAYISEENSAISWDIGVVDDASISVP
ncbi:hypothetical protein LAZ67_6000665 [Cordylochernes scorpioides]|uniref:Reverse transcriptase n=1 Tax=Cordylochernes scorpioides TaxID=51811 RepID=A0ABY6K298_9ARAC|nr:hypothetical protein LAZ67_1007080 [Cordylochernes scorpioides]UYV68751.1 hypothetical protein LAZ67_6000665 [Cordylochernes scorpioides]